MRKKINTASTIAAVGNWVFSNKNRLNLLRQDVAKLEQTLIDLGRAVAQARTALDEVGKRDRQWEKVTEFRWQDIDVPCWHTKVIRYQSDIEQLERAGGDLAAAKARWDEAKDNLLILQKAKDEQIAQVTAVGKDHENAVNQRLQALKHSEQVITPALREQLLKK